MYIKDFLSKKNIQLNNKQVDIYLCGPTLYDDLHIGNLRPLILFDQLIRTLDSLKIKHKYVVNQTDIDDKIITKAKQMNVSEISLANDYSKKYFELLKKFNINTPDYSPRVTKHIDDIIKFISDLVKKDFAYEKSGNVFFRVSKYSKYFELLKNRSSDIEQKSEFNSLKEDSKDFTIWKNTNEGVQYKSPWGKGRPGWHTECSCFVEKYFNKKTIQIHGGGIDLVFPHHTNEKAQFEVLHNNPLSKIWLYVGQVNINNIKMSKSLGNIIKAKDFEKNYSVNILKNIYISTSYSKPIDINENSIETSKKEIEKFKKWLLSTYSKLLLENKYKVYKLTTKDKKEIADILLNDFDFASLKNKINELMSLATKNNSEANKSLSKILFVFDLIGFVYKLNTNKTTTQKFVQNHLKKNYKISDKLRENLVELQ